MPTRSPALALSILRLAAGAAHAQAPLSQAPMPMDHAAHHPGMAHGTMAVSATPTMPGQDAFGTIQEGSVGVEC